MNTFKLKKILLVLCFFGFLFQFSLNSKEKKEEKTGYNFNINFTNITSNYSESYCYRVLKLAPWSTADVRDKQYQKLSEYYTLRGKKEEKQILDKAYLTLDGKYKQEKIKERTLGQVIFKGFQDLLILEGIFASVYIISKLCFLFQQYFNRFILFQIISFRIISRFFPHYFERELTQYLVSFAFGCLFFFRRKIFRLCSKKNDNAPAENENKSVTSSISSFSSF
ncbi:MAG: hypothetical protein MJ252_01880 [archaeon]|nr:hypothetical protein [archaeon]